MKFLIPAGVLLFPEFNSDAGLICGKITVIVPIDVYGRTWTTT